MIELSQRPAEPSCFPHSFSSTHRARIALGGGLSAILPPGDLPPRQRWEQAARQVMDKLDALDADSDGCLEFRPARIDGTHGVELRIREDQFPITTLLTHPMLVTELESCLRRILGQTAAIWIGHHNPEAPRLRALPLTLATERPIDPHRDAGWEGAFDISSGFLRRLMSRRPVGWNSCRQPTDSNFADPAPEPPKPSPSRTQKPTSTTSHSSA